jgi:hypothetical protein
MGGIWSTAPMHADRMCHNTKKKWMNDSAANSCLVCRSSFTLMFRRHHCRMCGSIVCDSCRFVVHISLSFLRCLFAFDLIDQIDDLARPQSIAGNGAIH